MMHLDEKTLVALFDACPDAMLVLDTAGLIVMANIQAEALFRYQPDALDGLAASRVIAIESAGTRPRTSGYLTSGVRRDGSTFQAEVSLATGDFSQGRLTTVAVRDVAERAEPVRAPDHARANQQLRLTPV